MDEIYKLSWKLRIMHIHNHFVTEKTPSTAKI